MANGAPPPVAGSIAPAPPMIPFAETLPRKSRLAALLDHLAVVDDTRDVRRITHRLDKILLSVVCGAIADCDDYEDIAAWGAAHLDFLRRRLPPPPARAARRPSGDEAAPQWAGVGTGAGVTGAGATSVGKGASIPNSGTPWVATSSQPCQIMLSAT